MADPLPIVRPSTSLTPSVSITPVATGAHESPPPAPVSIPSQLSTIRSVSHSQRLARQDFVLQQTILDSFSTGPGLNRPAFPKRFVAPTNETATSQPPSLPSQASTTSSRASIRVVPSLVSHSGSNPQPIPGNSSSPDDIVCLTEPAFQIPVPPQQAYKLPASLTALTNHLQALHAAIISSRPILHSLPPPQQQSSLVPSLLSSSSHSSSLSTSSAAAAAAVQSTPSPPSDSTPAPTSMSDQLDSGSTPYHRLNPPGLFVPTRRTAGQR